MSDRPILFNAESIPAILAGGKTQTRRIVKQISPEWELHDMDKIYTGTFNRDEPWPWRMTNPKKQYDGRLGVFVQFQTHVDDHATSFYPCPFGAPGDTLWVKEGYQITEVIPPFGMIRGRYLADDAPFQVQLTDAELSKLLDRKFRLRATPGRFMYKSLARIRTPVVSIRVERVQDITEEDARAGGVVPLFSHDDIHLPYYRAELDRDPMPYQNYLWHGHIGSGITAKQSDAWEWQYSSYKNARDSFSSLWDSIHGAGAWERNDWCWCVEFEEVGE